MEGILGNIHGEDLDKISVEKISKVEFVKEEEFSHLIFERKDLMQNKTSGRKFEGEDLK